MTRSDRNSRTSIPHRGGVYLAVLGTSLIVSVLGLTALLLQRIQNRNLNMDAAMRQAERNAQTAIQIGLLMMEQDDDWRTTLGSGTWLNRRDLGNGTCTLQVSDPADGNIADDPYEDVQLLGIGEDAGATQRLAVTVSAHSQPLGCLAAAVACEDEIDLTSDTLRASGLVTARRIDLNGASHVYGNASAESFSGTTFHDDKTVVSAAERPAMPDWNTVFDFYRANGTEIDIDDLPSMSPNMARNPGAEAGVAPWEGDPPTEPAADVEYSENYSHSGDASLLVKNRDDEAAGATQRIDAFVKPNYWYYIEAWVYHDKDPYWRMFELNLVTKGTSSSRKINVSGQTLVQRGEWRKLTASLKATAWSGDLEIALLKIDTTYNGDEEEFYVDDVVIREDMSGRYIYGELLSPSHNPFGSAQVNADGLYWIDCQGTNLRIERSRIQGTLLVIDPGGSSEIGSGPIHWTPAVPGYPALLVTADPLYNADFAIRATSRGLSEQELGINFNPSGALHRELGTDDDQDDIYPSEIRGLVVVGDDLFFENDPVVHGSVLVGDDLRNSSGVFEVQHTPAAQLFPPPGFVDGWEYRLQPGTASKQVAP